MHMRVHTFIHQYQYRYTNTEGYDYASIMCGDLYALTTSKVSTWAVPATRPMEPSFRAKSFEKPSILSAQAAGSGSPPGPRSKNFTLFLEWFSDARVYRNHIQTHSGAVFLQCKKSEYKRSYRVRGMGPPQGPAFACTVTTINKTKKKKTKNAHVLLKSYNYQTCCVFTARTNMFDSSKILTKLVFFLVSSFLFC